MKKRLSVLLVAFAVVLTLGSVSAEELKSSATHTFKNKDWFLSFEMGRYSDNASIGFDDIPEERPFYQLKHTLLAGKIGLGVRVTPQSSLALQYATGPRDSLQLYPHGEFQDTNTTKRSHFLSLVMSREFNVNVTDSVDAKFGITRATFENRDRLGQTGDTISRHTEVKPVIALGYRRAFSQRWSGGIEATSYFLSDPGIVTSVAVGLRCDL